MKKTVKGSVLIFALIAGLTACEKNKGPISEQPASEKINEEVSSNRMWNSTKQLYAVGHNGANQAFLYTLTPPPIGTGLVPGMVAGFFVGATQVTYAKGIACTGTGSTDKIVICTNAASNFPNQLLIYPAAGPYNAPVSVTSANLSDIEFNEYDGKMYGIKNYNQIVRINMTTGVTTTNLAPTLSTGYSVRGLCNYNGLLSYCISDNGSLPDNFYSYNPSSPSTTPALFNTEWGFGAGHEGGMQFCNGFGWVIITSDSFKKMVQGGPPYTVTGPLAMTGSPYFISDLTSN